MDVQQGQGDPDMIFPSDESIMSEVEKLRTWKAEGIDTSEMERALFTDHAEYNRLKIEFLTKRLGQTQTGPKDVSDRSSEEEPQDHRDPSAGSAEKDVITDSLIGPQKPIVDPYGDEIKRKAAYRDRTVDTVTWRIGRLTLDRKKTKTSFFIAIPVLVILLASGLGVYLLLMEGPASEMDTVPTFTISDLHPISGSVVNLTSDPTGDGAAHVWSIIPEGYVIKVGALDTPSLSVFFTKGGDYRVTHSVTAGGRSKEAAYDLTVDERAIRIDKESIGDRMEFRMEGSVLLKEVNTMFDFPDASDFRTMRMDYSSSSTTPSYTQLTEEAGPVKDGYSQIYSMILRKLEYNLELKGSILDSKGTSIPFDGEMTTTEENHIDLYNRKLARLDVTSTLHMAIQVSSGNTRRVDQTEGSSLFPDMSDTYRDLRLEDIAKDRYIHEDDIGTVLWGSSLLNWKVEKVERTMDVPCLNVSLWMDPGTLSENDLSDFDMHMLLADSYPVALGTKVHIASSKDVDNPYVLYSNQTLTGFRRGNVPIIYGTIDSYHGNTTNVFSVYRDLEHEFDEQWAYVPALGGMPSTIEADFDAEDAIAEFSDKPGFKNFVQGLDGPYAVYCNLSSMEAIDRTWKFTITDDGNPWGWNESVVKGSTVTTGFKARIDQVEVKKRDIGGALTFSGAETVMKRMVSDIDSAFAKDLYGVVPGDTTKLDLERNSIIVLADHSYPTIGMMDQGSFKRIDYCLILRSNDNVHECCLDLRTGQLLYLYNREKI